MKYGFLFLLALSFCSVMHAQFGVRIQQNYLTVPEYRDLFDGSDPMSFDYTGVNGTSFGLDYGFRLKKVRIEFYPTLHYQQSDIQETLPDNNDREWELQQFGVHLNTQIYLLDLDGDCDCPVWGKDGGVIERGLFVLVSPGVDYFREQFEYGERLFTGGSNSVTTTTVHTVVHAALGLGLDIGLSERVTISPYGGYRAFQTVNFKNLFDLPEANPSGLAETGRLRGWFVGARVGLHF